MHLSLIFNVKRGSPSVQNLTVVGSNGLILLHVKLQSDSYNFDIAKSEYDNQIALLPTVVLGEGTNFKKIRLQ
jgi:hypothetical protein